MTNRDIKWEEFENLIKDSKKTRKDFDEIKTMKQQIEENEKLNRELSNKISELSSQYKQEYSSKLNDRLDKYGILTVLLNSNDKSEGHIIYADKDIIKVRYYYNYNQYSKEVEVPTKELKDKGYYHIKEEYSSVYIIDKIKNPLEVFDIIKRFLGNEKGALLNERKWKQESVDKYTQEITKLNTEIEKYKQVSDTKITQMFNKISFGVTDLKIEELLEAIPRKIEI